MPATPPPTPADGPDPSGMKPLSRNASRLLVILSVLFVLGASIGGAYFLINLAERTARQQQEPASPTEESVIPDSIRRDTLGTPLPNPVEAVRQYGADFVVENGLDALVAAMNALTEEPCLDYDHLHPRRITGAV